MTRKLYYNIIYCSVEIELYIFQADAMSNMDMKYRGLISVWGLEKNE